MPTLVLVLVILAMVGGIYKCGRDDAIGDITQANDQLALEKSKEAGEAGATATSNIKDINKCKTEKCKVNKSDGMFR